MPAITILVARTWLLVGTSRCDVPARVQRAERIPRDVRTRPTLRRYYAARTPQRSVPTRLNAYGLLLLALGWLTGGCAAPSGTSAAPKPGKGIAEYRQVAREAHRSVTATVKSLEALAQPYTPTSAAHPALAGFDRAFHQLEITSVKARARAEAIITRGQTYFDEWKEQIAGVTNQTAARAETERYARLFDHFERVRQRSSEVREEFRPFMARLREFRARLDHSPSLDGELFRKQVDGLAANGRRVLQTLNAVSGALDEAEAELHATLAAQR